MTQVELAELKPCPFCGGPVALEKTIRKGADGRDWWGVVCRNTKNLGGTCAVQIRPSASKEAATERWNTRALEARIPQEDELREALKDARRYIANCWIDPVATEEERALVAKIDAALEGRSGDVG